MYDPQKIYDRLIEAGHDWADKKAAYDLIESTSKSVLSSIKRNNTYGKSDAERTSEALAHPDYKEHLTDRNTAYKAFLRAQVMYDSAKALADARRTQASTMRAEAKYTGMQSG
jgi:hypothetical protein